MNETFGSHEVVKDSFSVMHEAALGLLRNEGIDTSYADSFIGDVLSRRELQSAFTFHRLSPEQQISELLGIIDDPADESQIQVLFAKDNVPSDLLEYYRNKRSQKIDMADLATDI